MGKWFNVYVQETVPETVSKLSVQGLDISYKPDPSDPEEPNAYIGRGGGVVSSCVRWRASRNLDDLMDTVPNEAMSCLQLSDSSVNFAYILYKVQECLTILKTPPIDASILSSEPVKPTVQGVLDLVSETNIGMQLHGYTGEWKQEFDERLTEIGATLRSELGITPDEAMTLPGLTSLPPETETKFAEFLDFLRNTSSTKW